MELKIFPAGFDVVEFNAFQASNIIYKMNILNDGTIYVFWKSPNLIGRSKMELIEELDKVVKQSESEILAHSIDFANSDTTIADLKEKISKFTDKQDEYKRFDAEIKAKETQKLMAVETMEDRSRTIENAKAKVQEILNEK